MKQTKLLTAALAVLLLSSGCSATEPGQSSDSVAEAVADSPALPTEKNLVTLGDSISFGYGLEDPDSERYSVLLTQQLEARDGIIWNDYNYALSGDDSTDLLHNLNNGRAMRLPSADVIILYIGANNLLGVYSDYIREKAEQFEIDPETITEEKIDEIQEQLEAEMQDQEQMLQVFQEKIDSNLIRLENDLEEIYQWIRARNSGAEIYVLNVYNPYTEDAESSLFGDDMSFYAFADTQIGRVNTIISELTETHDDLVYVDIFSVFAACDTPPVIGTTKMDISDENVMDYYDPHPNTEGQQLIAEALCAAMEARS